MKIKKVKDYFVAENAFIYGNVIISANASIWYGCSIRGDLAAIRIGKYTNIQDNCVLHTDPGEELAIGDYVTVGHAAIIHCKSVGHFTLIGMGAILLAGATIGDNCVIGAGCLVRENQSIEDNSIVVGVPARVIGKTDSKHLDDHRDRAMRYYNLAVRHSS